MRNTDKAYLAGIIDGEGCVGIGIRKSGSRRGRYLTPTLQVTNTQKELLDWLYKRYGGGIYAHRQTNQRGRKPTWLWSCAGQKALAAIRDARPYMLLKCEQADILLALPRYSTKARDKLGRIKGSMTAREHAENDNVIERIRALNKRGV
jgi:hypothetical protein